MLKGKWIWEHFKWPVLLLATLKGWGWPFTALLTCLLRFTKKLAGKKTNLCLRLCLNYTWHINSTERRQSRKLAAKEDRGGDQEWHRMSSNSSFYPLYIPALLTTGCCPTSPRSIFFPWLAAAQPALAVRRCPSFCQAFSLCYRLQCLNILFHCLCIHKWMLSLLWLYKSVSHCEFFAHKWDVSFFFKMSCQTLNICILQSQ